MDLPELQFKREFLKNSDQSGCHQLLSTRGIFSQDPAIKSETTSPRKNVVKTWSKLWQNVDKTWKKRGKNVDKMRAKPGKNEEIRNFGLS